MKKLFTIVVLTSFLCGGIPTYGDYINRIDGEVIINGVTYELLKWDPFGPNPTYEARVTGYDSDGTFCELESVIDYVNPYDGYHDYTVTSIEDAFYGCTRLTSIVLPDCLTSIGGAAFYGCTGLTSITIPEGVKEIGTNAFKNCSSLTSINLPDGLTSIEFGTFYGCTALTSITIPDGVTSIGREAFKGCTGLTSITIPDGVTSIGREAFNMCENLTITKLPENLQIIGDRALNTCKLPVILKIPASVSEIGTNPFEYATVRAFTVAEGNQNYSAAQGVLYNADKTTIVSVPSAKTGSVTVPETVTEIGQVFKGCSNLTSIILHNGITSIEEMAFQNCSSLASVNIEDVTSIGRNAFENCSSLASVNIENATSIGREAFKGCTGLTSITIPDGITALYWAFEDCTGLTSVSLPDGLTILDGAFSGCTGLTSVNLPDGITFLDNAFRGCTGLTSITIPDGVTSLFHTFGGCMGLTSITIPNSVTSIGEYAFSGCRGLTSITIPESVTEIGLYAFSSCSSLTSIVIPEGVTSIGKRAFRGCSSLTSINLPDALTSIEASTFEDCIALTSITIPDGVTSILSAAFLRCYSLTSINLPDGLTSIGSGAFLDCTGLTSITIPDGVTEIPTRTFENCSNLPSIKIPNSVTQIYSGAFKNCGNLKTVYFLTSPSVYPSPDFPKGATIYVKSEKYLSEFLSSPAWKDNYSFEKLPITISVEKIVLNPSIIYLDSYGDYVLPPTYKIEPEDADLQDIEWSITSGNYYIYYDETNECLYGFDPGKAELTASAIDGSGVTAKCTVIVGNYMESDVTDNCLSVIGTITPSALSSLANNNSGITSVDLRNARLSNTFSAENLRTDFDANTLVYLPAGSTLSGNNLIIDGVCENFVLADDAVFAPIEDFTATTATYTRNVTSKYGTICLPYAVSSDASMKYYTLDRVEGSTLYLTEEAEIDAGVPAVFERLTDSGTVSATAANAAIKSTTVVPASGELKLIGTYEKLVITDAAELAKSYYISKDQFHQATNSLTVNPFRAYFTYTGSSTSKVFKISTEDDITAIGGIGGGGADVEGIYTVDGVKLPALQKGVNIVRYANGKTQKIIVR